MKNKNVKPTTTEAQILELLQQVLPKATHDPKLANRIYEAVVQELKLQARASSFTKFCAQAELPDLEPRTLMEIKRQLSDAFSGSDVTLKTNKKENCVAVELALPDGAQFTSEIQVKPVSDESTEDQDVEVNFVPFPVSLPGDQELVWFLAKRENFTPVEAGIALAKIEEEFWASKTGQKLLRDRVDRSFPEFIARVPAGMLSEAGLKRHYRTPEPVKVLRHFSRIAT